MDRDDTDSHEFGDGWFPHDDRLRLDNTDVDNFRDGMNEVRDGLSTKDRMCRSFVSGS
jgi:hypothetical protein